MANFIFQEVHRVGLIWIVGITRMVIGITVGSISYSSEESPDRDISSGVLILVNILLFNLELKTRIDPDNVSFGYFALIRESKDSFKDLMSPEVIEYNGPLEYGGWRVKSNLDSWRHATGGSNGISVNTAKKKYLLGTQKPEDAKAANSLFYKFKLQSHGS